MQGGPQQSQPGLSEGDGAMTHRDKQAVPFSKTAPQNTGCFGFEGQKLPCLGFICLFGEGCEGFCIFVCWAFVFVLQKEKEMACF